MKRVLTAILLSLTCTAGLYAAEPADGIDAMIAHLQFMGYRCAKNDKKVEARHDSKLSFDISPFRGGYMLRGWFTRSDKAAAQKAKYAELINKLNSESSLVRFYYDKETDLIIEAWYPGKYGKESFAAFMTAWEQDFISAVQKNFAEMKVFISN